MSLTFSPKLYDITFSIDGNGGISPTQQSIKYNQSVSFTITPDEHYEVNTVNGCQGNLSGNTYTINGTDGHCEVSLSFKEKYYQVTTAILGEGSLSITETELKNSQMIDITVSPEVHHEISNINGCQGVLNGDLYVLSEVTEDCQITADFTPKLYSVSTSVIGDGTISPDASQLTHQDNQTFSMLAGNLQQVASVTGCSGIQDGNNYTVSNVDSDCEISVEFEAVPAVNESYESVSVTELTLPLKLQNVNHIEGLIEDITALDKPDRFNFNDISFRKSDNIWYVKNNTPIPINALPVQLGSNKAFTLVKLSETLPEYSEAEVDFPSLMTESIIYAHQYRLFNPTITIGPNNVEELCTDKEKTCYSLPNIEERKLAEITAINIYNLANTKSYANAMLTFFENRCNYDNAKCGNYNNPQLPYGVYNLLKFAAEGHRLTLKIMRNQYSAEGMGGGSGANLSAYINTSGGWASIWQSYINENHRHWKNGGQYYNIWYHEIAHAVGMSHASGMTYGFADYFAKNYMPGITEQQTRTSRGTLKYPELVMDANLNDEKALNVSFANLGNNDISEVKIKIITACKWTFNTEYFPSKDNTGLTLSYDTPPKCPLFIRASTETSDNVATLKIAKTELSTSPRYKVGSNIFTVLSVSVLEPNDNGWAIRRSCELPGSNLATKSQYQELWDHLSDNNKLGELSVKVFLSRDEPLGYRIWKLTFDDDAMKSGHYWMTHKLGNDKALVCVSSAE
ncbi:hypothetical protein CS022_02505 [Veronia nyctiphanis]|uniref:Uncharacterized protein n=1 Tax=Veronia nyctiphanis TaxID=1278244 RepID=A0A4Q0YZ39_9GAMM|nr:hypothetical protein [Veronia nyctiphanis]RXJ74479.1 hypothetical protein CS022_02505 [Veronia nyctiphanis]